MQARSCLTFLILLCGAYLASPVYADDFSHAKTLLKQNKAKEAYRFLFYDEGYHMGEPDYDLLLAQAALAAEMYHESIFAFERVLLNNPNNYQAHLDIAVAYFRINELENAQRHIKILLAAKPSGELRTQLDKYVELINERIDSRRHEVSGSHTLLQGWDNNINSATNESEIRLAIGNYRPTEGIDKKTADTYTESINRINYDYHRNVNSSFHSSLGYSIRENNHKNFDTQSADVKIAYQHKTAIGVFNFPLSYQTMWLDEKQLRYVNAIGSSLNRSDQSSYTQYHLQYGEIRYPGQAPLNVDHVLLSFGFGTTSSKATVNQNYALFYGDEQEKNALYRFNARRYMGAQIQLPIRLTSHQYLSPRIMYQKAEYKQRHPFFLDTRQDIHRGIAINWNWFLDRHWQVIGEVSHAVNDSTVGLYSYDRSYINLGMTYKY